VRSELLVDLLSLELLLLRRVVVVRVVGVVLLLLVDNKHLLLPKWSVIIDESMNQ